MQTLSLSLDAGTCPVLLFGDAADRTTPIVILFMDAFGPRPVLFDLAESLASDGYRVLLPDLFYRHAPYRPLDPQSLFSGGEDRARLHVLIGGLDQEALDADVAGLLALCRELSDGPARIGVTGYCMGGRYVLTAASLGPEVLAAACFHSSKLAPETAPSAHTRLSGSNARIYIGVADPDPSFDAAEQGRLAAALRAAQTDHIIESYKGAAHGFVMADLPVFNQEASGRHRERLRELFTQMLG